MSDTDELLAAYRELWRRRQDMTKRGTWETEGFEPLVVELDEMPGDLTGDTLVANIRLMGPSADVHVKVAGQ